MFNPQHCGLFFTVEHIQRARDKRETEPYLTAWNLLNQRRQLDLIQLAQSNGLLYRFSDDTDSGQRAVAILQEDDLTARHKAGDLDVIASVLTQAQCFEMVRDHPAFTRQADWLDTFTRTIKTLNQPWDERPYVAALWLNALNLAAAIVLEDEGLFAEAVDTFQETIRHDVHPEGYIRKATSGERGTSLHRMLLAAQALILTAEAATHAGENLWAFNERGVSALTPTPYLLYYYYYPEKWRWDAELKDEEVPEEGQSLLDPAAAQALYRQHAGLWEMAQHQSPSQDRQNLLNELRPIDDLWGGGLVTLTHGTVEYQPRRRFRLFG